MSIFFSSVVTHPHCRNTILTIILFIFPIEENVVFFARSIAMMENVFSPWNLLHRKLSCVQRDVRETWSVPVTTATHIYTHTRTKSCVCRFILLPANQKEIGFQFSWTWVGKKKRKKTDCLIGFFPLRNFSVSPNKTPLMVHFYSFPSTFFFVFV